MISTPASNVVQTTCALWSTTRVGAAAQAGAGSPIATDANKPTATNPLARALASDHGLIVNVD